MEMKRIKENIISSLVFMALSIILYLQVIPWGVPLRASWGGDVGVDSRTFPYFSALAMGLIACAFFLVSLYQYGKKKMHEQPKEYENAEERHTIKEELLGLATFGLFIAYGLLLVSVGFIIATLVIPPIILVFLGHRKLSGFISVYVFSAILYMVFQYLLKVQLP